MTDVSRGPESLLTGGRDPSEGSGPSPTPDSIRTPPVSRRCLGFILGLVVVFAGCGSASQRSGSAGEDAPGHYTVTYSITGSGTRTVNLITYNTLQRGKAHGGEAQLLNHAIPWTKTITVSARPTSYSLSVQNGSVGLSYVTCTISEGGKVLDTNTAKGPLAVAGCIGAGAGAGAGQGNSGTGPLGQP